jgi:hypothetical protein
MVYHWPKVVRTTKIRTTKIRTTQIRTTKIRTTKNVDVTFCNF